MGHVQSHVKLGTTQAHSLQGDKLTRKCGFPGFPTHLGQVVGTPQLERVSDVGLGIGQGL